MFDEDGSVFRINNLSFTSHSGCLFPVTVHFLLLYFYIVYQSLAWSGGHTSHQSYKSPVVKQEGLGTTCTLDRLQHRNGFKEYYTMFSTIGFRGTFHFG